MFLHKTETSPVHIKLIFAGAHDLLEKRLTKRQYLELPTQGKNACLKNVSVCGLWKPLRWWLSQKPVTVKIGQNTVCPWLPVTDPWCIRDSGPHLDIHFLFPFHLFFHSYFLCFTSLRSKRLLHRLLLHTWRDRISTSFPGPFQISREKPWERHCNDLRDFQSIPGHSL